MPIPPTDELLVKEEIKSALLEKALVELAVEFAKADPSRFSLIVDRVVKVAKTHPVKRFVPPAVSNPTAFEVERIQQEGFALAIETLSTTLYRIRKRIRPDQKP